MSPRLRRLGVIALACAVGGGALLNVWQLCYSGSYIALERPPGDPDAGRRRVGMLVRRPSTAELKALRSRVDGPVRIHCRVQASGWLADCAVKASTASRLEVDRAALALADRFRLDSMDGDRRFTAGAGIEICIEPRPLSPWPADLGAALEVLNSPYIILKRYQCAQPS